MLSELPWAQEQVQPATPSHEAPLEQIAGGFMQTLGKTIKRFVSHRLTALEQQEHQRQLSAAEEDEMAELHAAVTPLLQAIISGAEADLPAIWGESSDLQLRSSRLNGQVSSLSQIACCLAFSFLCTFLSCSLFVRTQAASALPSLFRPKRSRSLSLAIVVEHLPEQRHLHPLFRLAERAVAWQIPLLSHDLKVASEQHEQDVENVAKEDKFRHIESIMCNLVLARDALSAARVRFAP